MSHVDDGQLNALLDGELSAEEARATRAHLETCASCKARFAEAQRFLTEADVLLQHVLPPSAAAPPAPAQPSIPAIPSIPHVVAEEPRRVSKTGKEAAIDIDGATHQSPAIRLFGDQAARHAVPAPAAAAPENRKPKTASRFNPNSLAWAASVVLMFGIGYIANEIRHGSVETGEVASADRVADTMRSAAPAAAEADPRAGVSVRGNAGAASGGPAVPAGELAAKLQPVGRRSEGTRQQRPSAAADAARLDAPSRTDAVASAAGAGVATPTAPAENRAQPPATVLQRPNVSPPAGPPAGLPSPAPAAAPAPLRDAGDLAGAPSRERARLAATAPAEPATFRRINIDTAVVRLSGSIRMIDDMTGIERVDIGPGRLVPGAAPGLEVVRITYRDASGQRIVLEQQRLPAADEAAAAAGRSVGLLYGDTLVTVAGGTTRVRWLDRKSFWLSLSGPMSADSLRALVSRVR